MNAFINSKLILRLNFFSSVKKAKFFWNIDPILVTETSNGK